MEFRWSFNVTLLIAGVFGLASGGSNSFVTLASLLAVLGIGVGGNLPVDSAVFLGRKAIRFNHLTSLFLTLDCVVDFVPGSHQYLLTVLSIWWSLGQLFANLVCAFFSPSVVTYACQFSCR